MNHIIEMVIYACVLVQLSNVHSFSLCISTYFFSCASFSFFGSSVFVYMNMTCSTISLYSSCLTMAWQVILDFNVSLFVVLLQVLPLIQGHWSPMICLNTFYLFPSGIKRLHLLFAVQHSPTPQSELDSQRLWPFPSTIAAVITIMKNKVVILVDILILFRSL